MLSRAITRSTFTGAVSVAKELDRAPQPVLEPGGRLVAEDLACGGDVGPRVADVARARRRVAAVDGLVEDAGDRLHDLVHARRGAGGDVEDPAARALGAGGADRRVDHVLDVGEVPGLLAVAED